MLDYVVKETELSNTEVEKVEVPEEENKQGVELTPLELILFELDSNSLKSYYGFCDLSKPCFSASLDKSQKP